MNTLNTSHDAPSTMDDLDRPIDPLDMPVEALALDADDTPALADDLTPLHSTREEWLTRAVQAVRQEYPALPLPQNIRVACGFPSTASRSGTVGETWADTASRDKTIEILISPVIDKPSEVLAVLLSQLAHALPGAMNHGTAYRAAAQAFGLEPLRADWKATRGAEDFESMYQKILSDLGPYPHAALVPTSMKAKQTTRLLKVQCPDPICGYTVRVTGKWIKVGLPTCCCGTPMTQVDSE